MPIIIKRPHAINDITEIWNHIADDSEELADSFIDFIDQKFRTLAEQPNIGRIRDELAESLRSFPVGRYVIYYRVLPGRIEIVRVLHGARDVDSIFHSED